MRSRHDRSDICEDSQLSWSSKRGSIKGTWTWLWILEDILPLISPELKKPLGWEVQVSTTESSCPQFNPSWKTCRVMSYPCGHTWSACSSGFELTGRYRMAWCHCRIGPFAALHVHRWQSSGSTQTMGTSHLHYLYIHRQNIHSFYADITFSEPSKCFWYCVAVLGNSNLLRQTGQHFPSIKDGFMQDTGGQATCWHTTFPS